MSNKTVMLVTWQDEKACYGNKLYFLFSCDDRLQHTLSIRKVIYINICGFPRSIFYVTLVRFHDFKNRNRLLLRVLARPPSGQNLMSPINSATSVSSNSIPSAFPIYLASFASFRRFSDFKRRPEVILTARWRSRLNLNKSDINVPKIDHGFYSSWQCTFQLYVESMRSYKRFSVDL